MSEILELDSPLLTAWCATKREYGRYMMEAPFVSGGKRCYSDGKRLVWLDGNYGADTPKAPPAKMIFFDPEQYDDWKPFSDLESVERQFARKPCAECSGIGNMPLCNACEGEGECGSEHSCDCDSWQQHIHPIGPVPPCEECHGRGYTEEECDRTVLWVAGGYRFDMLFVNHAAALPGATWRVGTTTKYLGETPVLMVRFDGGAGLVVPEWIQKRDEFLSETSGEGSAS